MDNLDSQIEIQFGIPEEHRHQAASILYDGLVDQMGKFLLGSRQKVITLMAHSLNIERGLAAQTQGQLVGLVGLKYENLPFCQFERSHCIRELGFLRGSLAFRAFNNVAFTKPLSDEMCIDVLVVDASMRGKGIGSLLMQSAFEIALKNQCTAVIVDVASTNPNARRLYERLGFKFVRTLKFKYLPKWISQGSNLRKELTSS